MSNSVLTSSDYQIIPCTTAPYQIITITLNGQAVFINLYTKSINVPVLQPGQIPIDPNPEYENTNPVFIDLFLNGNLPENLIVGGVIARNGGLIVRNTYFGFVGDIAIIDTQGNDDPYGVPYRLPPAFLRNRWQENVPLLLKGFAPPAVAGTMPGMGTRFLLTYWPTLP